MNIFEAAMNKAGVKTEDFEIREFDEKTYEIEEKIKFFEDYLKLVEKKSSEKELHQFVTSHGFVSHKQFSLWLSVSDDADNLQMQLDDEEMYMSLSEKKKIEKEIKERRSMAENIKEPYYYSFIMRQLKQKDISPYGEDILKSIREKNSTLFKDRVFTEKDFKTCDGYWCRKVD